jgi:uncharacterized membrane protein YbhN (UPF0104 family)
MWQAVAFVAKATVSAFLIYLAVRNVDLALLGERLSGLDFGWVLAAVGLAVAQLFLLSIRWRQIADACGALLPLRPAFRFSLIGVCFNQALPSGGDVMRVWLFARAGAGWSKAVYSVLLDRFVGVLALTILVVACLPWTLALIQNPAGRAALLLLGSVAVAGAAGFVAFSYAPWPWLHRWAATRHAIQMAVSVRTFLFSAKVSVPVMALSLTIHVLTVAMACCLAQAIGAPFGFFYALRLVPPVMLVTVIPISVAGWGVREKSLVWAFAMAGLPQADGFLVSVLLGLVMVFLGSVGGIVWLAGGERTRLVKEPLS